MLLAGVIENGVVVNTIYIDQENFDTFVSRGRQLINAIPLGLRIGDTTTDGVTFYRDGVQLPIPNHAPTPEELLAEADMTILNLTQQLILAQEGLT